MSEWKAAQAGESEAQWREFLAYLFAQASTGIATTGVLAGLGVTQTATASGSIIVGRGCALVQPSLTTGVLPLVGDDDKTIDVLTASPMGALPRNDLVIFNADTGKREVVVGSPNASPTDPTVSANHVKLARIRNAANATTIPASAIDPLQVSTSLAPTPAPAVQSAVVGSSWSGYVKYVVEGKKVTVTYAVQRTTTTGTLAAWDFLTVATGLPKCADARPAGASGLMQGLAASNGTQFPQFGHGVDPSFSGGTVLSLQPRWVNQTISAGTWFSGSFSYFTA